MDRPVFYNEETKMFLMRWNPEISDFTPEEMKKLTDKFNMSNGGYLQWRWAIKDWREASDYDLFVMLREGSDEKAGIIMVGTLNGDPYRGKDWRGTGEPMHYVDMISSEISSPDEPPLIALADLEQRIKDIDWHHGHCGVLLTEDQTSILLEILREKHCLDWMDIDYEDDDDEDYLDFEDELT